MRIIEYADSVTSVPKQKWNAESYWWNLLSQWYDGSENSDYGMEPWKFSLLNGIQSWKLNSRTEVCIRTAGLQITMQWIKEVEASKSITNSLYRDRSQDNNILLISMCLMRLLRQPRRSSSIRNQTSDKDWVSKSNEPQNSVRFFRGETNCIHDLRVFPCNRSF